MRPLGRKGLATLVLISLSTPARSDDTPLTVALADLELPAFDGVPYAFELRSIVDDRPGTGPDEARSLILDAEALDDFGRPLQADTTIVALVRRAFDTRFPRHRAVEIVPVDIRRSSRPTTPTCSSVSHRSAWAGWTDRESSWVDRSDGRPSRESRTSETAKDRSFVGVLVDPAESDRNVSGAFGAYIAVLDRLEWCFSLSAGQESDGCGGRPCRSCLRTRV